MGYISPAAYIESHVDNSAAQACRAVGLVLQHAYLVHGLK